MAGVLVPAVLGAVFTEPLRELRCSKAAQPAWLNAALLPEPPPQLLRLGFRLQQST